MTDFLNHQSLAKKSDLDGSSGIRRVAHWRALVLNLIEEYLPSRRDRRIFAIALFFSILWSAVFILDPDWAQFGDDFNTVGNRAALIVEKKNDVRAKRAGTLFWLKARQKMPLTIGDSIFVGSGSNSALRFVNGIDLKLRENTLISIAGDENNPILELHQGDIQVDPQAAEKLSIKIGADVIKVDTRQEGLGTLLLTRQERGSTQITHSGSRRIEIKISNSRADETKVTSLNPNLPILVESTLAPTNMQTQISTTLLTPFVETPNFYSRPLRYSDLYTDARVGKIQMKALSEGQIISASVQFKIREGDPSKPLFYQVSSQPDFRQPLEEVQLPIGTREGSIKRLYYSTSFIRFSHDQRNWTEIQSLPISLFESSLPPLKLSVPVRPSLVQNSSSRAIVPLEFRRLNEKIEFIVIEVSPFKSFPIDRTDVVLRPFSERAGIELPEGRFFIRSRGLLAEGTLTPYSETLSHQVTLTPRLTLMRPLKPPKPTVVAQPDPHKEDLPARIPAAGSEVAQTSVHDLPSDYRPQEPLKLSAYFHLGTLNLSANVQALSFQIPQSGQANFIRSGLVLSRMPISLEAFLQSSSGASEFKDTRFGAGLNYWVTRESTPSGFIAQYYRQSRSELIGDFNIDFMKLGGFLGFAFNDKLTNHNEITYGINTKGGSIFGLQTALNYQFSSSFQMGLGAATENFSLTLENFKYRSNETSIFSRIRADF